MTFKKQKMRLVEWLHSLWQTNKKQKMELSGLVIVVFMAKTPPENVAAWQSDCTHHDSKNGQKMGPSGWVIVLIVTQKNRTWGHLAKWLYSPWLKKWTENGAIWLSDCTYRDSKKQTEHGAIWLSDCTHCDSKKWTENGAIWLSDCTHRVSKNGQKMGPSGWVIVLIMTQKTENGAVWFQEQGPGHRGEGSEWLQAMLWVRGCWTNQSLSRFICQGPQCGCVMGLSTQGKVWPCVLPLPPHSPLPSPLPTPTPPNSPSDSVERNWGGIHARKEKRTCCHLKYSYETISHSVWGSLKVREQTDLAKWCFPLSHETTNSAQKWMNPLLLWE